MMRSSVASALLLGVLVAAPASVLSQQVVDSFVLVNAKTGQDIMVLENFDVIKLNDVGTELSIRADVRNVPCLEFNLDEGATIRVDGAAPYYFAGNSDDGEIYAANSLTQIGLHTLMACPTACGQLFAPQRSAEELQNCLTVNFEVAQSEAGETVVEPTSDVDTIKADVYGILTGELKQWHTITLAFAGPPASEMGTTNPVEYRVGSAFADYKLDVTFVASDGSKFVVPGYYAGNGNTANDSSANGGDWHVHFVPPKTGKYTWTASYRQGGNVAQFGGGDKGNFFDGATGEFEAEASDKTGDDFRGKGRLVLSNGKWQFSGTGETFLKVGVASPTNLLAYADFDDTSNLNDNLKTYSAHELDFNPGDPTWAEGKGTGLIGAINYLASVGVNAMSITTLDLEGDDENIYPFVNPKPISTEENFLQYDISKLAQWNIIMDHAETMGVSLRIRLFDNDQVLDSGNGQGNHIKLYMREMVARFGHHLSVTWNIGDDISVSEASIRSKFIDSVDPYKSPIEISTYNPESVAQLKELPLIDSVAVLSENDVYSDVLAAGPGMTVLSIEVGTGAESDEVDSQHDAYRENALWGAVMGGAEAVLFHFGTSTLEPDLMVQDFRTRSALFQQAQHLQTFFSTLPLADMSPSTILVDAGSYCLADSMKKTIVAYKKAAAASVTLDLSTIGTEKGYSVNWFSPSVGGALIPAQPIVKGGASWTLAPPSNPTADWALLVQCATNCE